MAAGTGQNNGVRLAWQLGRDKQRRQADKLGWDKTKQSGWHGSWARTEQRRQADMAAGLGQNKAGRLTWQLAG